jgi:hypothetical protein
MDAVPHLLTWPRRRTLTTGDGVTVLTVIEPGRLRIETPGGAVHTCTDVAELRAFAMQVYAAAVDHDQSVQHAAAKASADRKQARALRGHPRGLRHGPFTDIPEPPAHMEVPA